MNNDPEKIAGRVFAVFMIIIAVIMIWIAVEYLPSGRSSNSSAGSRYDNYEPGTNYRYYNSSKSSSSGSSSKSSTSKNSGSKSSSSGSAKKYTPRKKSAKEQAYDDFMDDALEDYLSCVDDMDEYWDAVDNFDEGWLTPDEREELDRLMKSFDE